MMKLWIKIKPFILHYIIFAIILTLVVYFLYWHFTSVKIQPTVKVLTKTIPVTKRIVKYKTLIQTKIKYIPKVEYQQITKTKLPKEFKNKKILATGKVPPYKGDTLVTSILNTKSGEDSLFFQQLPYTQKRPPFFAFPNQLSVSGGVGFLTDKNGTKQSETIGVNYKYLRIGKFNFRVQDNIFLNSANTVNFVGTTIGFKFK